MRQHITLMSRKWICRFNAMFVVRNFQNHCKRGTIIFSFSFILIQFWIESNFLQHFCNFNQVNLFNTISMFKNILIIIWLLINQCLIDSRNFQSAKMAISQKFYFKENLDFLRKTVMFGVSSNLKCTNFKISFCLKKFAKC